MRWWQRLLKRDQLERQLHAELRFHFDCRVDELVRAGLSGEEAERQARLDIGAILRCE